MNRPEWTLCGAAYALLIGVALAGCVATQPADKPGPFDFVTASARNTQVALESLIALDTAQTVTIARSPECLFEADPLAAAVYGTRHPDPARVLVTNVLYMTGHFLLAAYLDRRANAPVDLSIPAEQDIARHKRARLLQRIYQFATAFGHGAAVVNNEARGIKPFSSFRCGDGQ